MDSANDLKIFNQMYAEYRTRFIRFAYTYVRDTAAAEDITADAFVHYWENRASLQPDTNPPAYVLGVIKNKCLNHLQHLRVRETVEKELQNHAEWELRTRVEMLEACNPEELFVAEIQDIVKRTLAKLPARTRQIFTMSRNENMPYNEIATKTNMTPKGVEFHISKALKALRNSLKDYMTILFL